MTETIKEPINDIEDYIRKSLEQIKFGSVEITIHDSKIVQVERSDKVRFNTISS